MNSKVTRRRGRRELYQPSRREVGAKKKKLEEEDTKGTTGSTKRVLKMGQRSVRWLAV